VDNEFSILNATDLVFIDPVATGFSRPPRMKSLINFLASQATLNRGGIHPALDHAPAALALPKYLCGESYGVFRAAGLAEHLHSRHGMYLNGVVLLSGVLDFATLREGPGNDLPSLVFLPAFTATAHYHKKLPPDLQADLPKALAESRAFAQGEYALALLRGSALPGTERAKIVTRLARLTGLPNR